jgi:hypothetical protein
MRYVTLIVCVIGSLACICSNSHAQRQSISSRSAAEAKPLGTSYGDYVIGDPVVYKNLAIFPISSKVPKNQDRYTTLDEGLASGTVKVTEVGAERDTNRATANGAGEVRQSANQAAPQAQRVDQSAAPNALSTDSLFGTAEGDVNKLMVTNKSGKPLYLMPGEVISGGEQDRTIGEETVIDSSNKAVPIDVFCVEQGRWAGRSLETTTAQLGSAEFNHSQSLVVRQSASVNELAKESKSGKFVAGVGQLNKDSRLAVQQSQAQGKVWDEVAKANSKVGNKSESGNFAENYFARDTAKELEPFFKNLKPIGETKQIVGVAVTVDGKMLAVDVFESTPLFKKFWPKLLKSYAFDAVAATSDSGKEKKPESVAISDCIAFLKDVEKSKSNTTTLEKGQKIDKRDSSKAISFSCYNIRSSSAAGGGGAFGGSVHTSVLSK